MCPGTIVLGMFGAFGVFGARFCARAMFLRLAPCFYTLAVLMLGIRPDCLRSEPRL